MANGDNQAKVLIELQLEMKKLKQQLKSVMGQFKDFKKELEGLGKVQEEGLDAQVDGLKKIDQAQNKVSKAWARSEKQKAKAVRDSTKQLKEQEKELTKIQRLWKGLKGSGPGRLAGGFAAGAGLAGMGRGLGSMRGIGGTAGRLVSRGVGGLVGFGISGLTNAYQTYMQYGMAMAGLTGLGTPRDLRRGLRAAGGVGGAGLGYTPTETVQQAVGIGRATGNIGAIYRAQQFARGYGLDVGEAGGYMGMLRQAGYGFGGQVRGPGGAMTATRREGSRELTKIIEAGMISGLEKGRIGEFLQGVSSITGQLGSQLPGKINVSGIAAQAAMLGQSKLPGFQGARGMQLLARLNQAIQRPGGGEAGQAMMLQALGFGKPGGGTRYYEALKMQEEGIHDPRNLPKLMKEVYSQLGDPAKGGRSMVNEEANLAMKEITGLSLKQVEGLQNIMASGKSAEDQQKEIKELLKKAEPIEKQALEESKKGFTGVMKHVAGVESKQISIGSKFAPIFQKLQNLQLDALKMLTNFLPEIVKWLRESFNVLYGIYQGALKTLGGETEARRQQIMKQHFENLQKIGVIPKEYVSLGQRFARYRQRQVERGAAIKQMEGEYRGAVEGPGWLERTFLPSSVPLNKIMAARMKISLDTLRESKRVVEKRFGAEKRAAKRLGVEPGMPVGPATKGFVEQAGSIAAGTTTFSGKRSTQKAIELRERAAKEVRRYQRQAEQSEAEVAKELRKGPSSRSVKVIVGGKVVRQGVPGKRK